MNLSLEPFFNNSIHLLCIAGFDGYFKKVNPAFVSLLGYSVEELMSKKISDFIFEDDRDLTNGFRESLMSGTPLVNFENRYISKCGKIIWLNWTSIPLTNEQLIYALAKDISYRKELEGERAAEFVKLDKKNENLKTLNYKTSHDLRSPINNILALSNLLDLDSMVDKENVKILELIKVSAEGLKKSLDDYIDHLKHADTLEIQEQELSFEEVLGDVQKTISTLIESARAEFTLDFAALETISFNRPYLESIFLNFISNSIKYAKPNSVPKIKITSKVEGGRKKLIYTDAGLGFDMNRVGDKIFEVNYGFHNNKESKGVGLYLVRNHVHKLGGTISVKSDVNVGTTFTITFK
ncbi:PAS domain-containing sensor histidine kinase [Cellulophaga sp. Hel_I_12]|uniref:PAS domain-containing sensor histidine kinase n=1 Tax=Cellulophaga sp. Hel_I_12 TaxID=1249972 RepID=UPI0006457667|nr:PAS domain-containing sensor histidine kinase [Cellulophaga sp. Hel_I_12]